MPTRALVNRSSNAADVQKLLRIHGEVRHSYLGEVFEGAALDYAIFNERGT
ncbi:MAG: hypothetical protein JWQ35_459 [Bacteriovoracaceae bacterium]|nr:hypothetical protein [Bacteriovoracaceae bacterium]